MNPPLILVVVCRNAYVVLHGRNLGAAYRPPPLDTAVIVMLTAKNAPVNASE